MQLGNQQKIIIVAKSRTRDSTSVDLAGSSLHFAVWVSFAEIYNENIYDLFERIPEAKKGVGETVKPRRSPLTIGSDKASGSPFIRNLKEVFVNSADEAYQLSADPGTVMKIDISQHVRIFCLKLFYTTAVSLLGLFELQTRIILVFKVFVLLGVELKAYL